MSSTRNTDAPLSLTAWLRYDAIERLLPGDAVSILEIGAGLGSLGAFLARRYEYTGVEPDARSYAIARDRIGGSGRVLNVPAEALGSEELFDVVCAFEVLEHCEDDAAALAGWCRHIRPGGHALLSVPFGRARFGSWDTKAGHYRRYDRDDIVTTMERAGLVSVDTMAYGFPLGSLTQAARNLVARFETEDASIEERTAASARGLQPPVWASVATRFVSAPFRLLQRPFAGTSLGPGIVARGRRPVG